MKDGEKQRKKNEKEMKRKRSEKVAEKKPGMEPDDES